MGRHSIPAVLLTIVAVAGCNHLPGLQTVKDPPPNVRTSATRYRPGESGTVIVSNRGGHTIGFNSCPITLEQLVGTAWRAAPGGIQGPESIAGCSTSFLLVGSGDSAQTRFTLAPNVGAGTYRLRLARVEGRDSAMGADSAGARTNPITVAP
jgi:hypothetical protein